MDTKEYIEQLQKQYGVSLIEQGMRSARFKKHWEGLKDLGVSEDIVRGASELRYTECCDMQREDDVANIVRFMDINDLKIPDIPEIIYLPTQDCNAWATIAPNGDPICVLDTALEVTIFAVCLKIAEATLAPLNPGMKPDYFRCAHTIYSAAVNMFRGIPEKRYSYLKRNDTRKDLGWLRPTMELSRIISFFIIVHEFSHHARGHVGRPLNVRLSTNERKQLSVISRHHSDEFEADELATKIFLFCYKERMEFTSQCAPLLFFDFLSFCERSILNLGDSEDERPTHPPAHERQTKIKEIIWDVVDQRARDYYTFYSQFWDVIQKVLGDLENDDGLLKP